MFEVQYNEMMEAEVQRLEAKKRAIELGHPEWDNACVRCGCVLASTKIDKCAGCLKLD